MKRNLRLLILLPLLLLGFNELKAQRVDYTTDSGWDIGFGVGGSYQSSDIRNFTGGGATLLVGRSIFQKQNAPLSLDWRLRILGGQNIAFDDRINTDGSYNNIKYTHFNYDLEFVLTLNRLRENTGIILSGFGGGGVAHSMTSFDLEKSGAPYDYSSINADGNDNRSEIYTDLKELSDYDFETADINRGSLTPTLGLYLGYQFTPRFSLGIEHKTNYFMEEDNSISGANIDGVINHDSHIDRNHYTGLLLKWDIGYATTPTPPCVDPVVSFIVGKVDSEYVTHKLNGTVTNIKNANNIAITVDGNPDVYFKFDATSGQINSQYNFAPGKHTISIYAQNNCGEDTETVQVIVEQPCFPPDVDFIIEESLRDNFTHILKGTVSNILRKENISLSINGINKNDFEFNPNTNEISCRFNLEPGKNNIILKANNECGNDEHSFELDIEKPCPKPKVEFTVNEITTAGFTHKLIGTIQNISSKNEITLLIDGRTSTSFVFDVNTGQITANLKLNPGNHILEIRAKNECAEESFSINVMISAPCDIPELKISVNEINSENSLYQLEGFIKNVKDKNNIYFFIDNKQNNSFEFNTNTGEINNKFKLDAGKHEILVTAKNECGEDTEAVVVEVAVPCFPPEIKYSVKEVANADHTHLLDGLITNIVKKEQISVFVDGKIN
ncbi:MAG: hypothetical protein JXR36_11465, partial [Bacteroidales bacterium]|nr:hypothetical protein [Bacteroidales bacterium]